MAKLKYDKKGRLLFTKEMKKEYTVLLPMMLPIHFTLMRNSLRLEGYKAELLTTNHRNIVNQGLKYVHNDSCYPALLVIGQLLDAVKSGEYDEKKLALMITQTGGGCRASNYIHLLRKALKNSGLSHIPVISLNLSGLEKNPGFKLSYRLIKRFAFAILYGDLIMLLANQCRPYEVNKGDTDRLVDRWLERLTKEFSTPKLLKYKRVKENYIKICDDFSKIEVKRVPKVKVGIVGEIYIKYAPLGNNNLEEFLQSEGAEVVVPGLLDFVLFKADNRTTDIDLYGGSKIKQVLVDIFLKILVSCQKTLIDTVSRYPDFRPPVSFNELKKLVKGYLGYGNKMGEGWLLLAEMLEFVTSGVNNVICTQPFGCLPNHVAGKGMIRKIKNNYPESNIVAIDYDPGATKINQENRIKLMLSNAKK